MGAQVSSLPVSRLVLRARQLEIDAARLLAGRVELVDVVGQMIHALQRERGASALLLASQGQRFQDVQSDAVAQARPVAARLQALFDAHAQSEGVSARTVSLMAWTLLGLDALDELRGSIVQGAVGGHDAVVAFSRLIAGLVELMFQLADASLVPGVSQLLVALVHLVQGKEAAGQERAIGALLFASGMGNEAQRQRILHLIDAQERSLQVFMEFAEEGLREQWEREQLSPMAARLERLRRLLCTGRADAKLDSTQSDAWFEVSSQRITALWLVEEELVSRLRDACTAQIAAAEQDLQDSEGLLKRWREAAPANAYAVDRFFDSATPPTTPAWAGGADASSMLELLQSQSARLASVEAELAAARRTLNERKIIERAKGLLMQRMGMTEEAAFRALQKTSMDQNRKLVDVAEAALGLPDFAFAQLAQDPHQR